jgi:hypothetical protein
MSGADEDDAERDGRDRGDRARQREESKSEDRVGYRRPPKSGQFRKGQSGNPRGRPRKPRAAPKLEPARFPTSEVLRAEAARVIAINDAKGRQELTTTEAVVRALGLAAMRGGVLAQRTYLEHQKAEDERLHAERQASYAFWTEYCATQRHRLAAARAAGQPDPELVPHPDDIVLDPWSLAVQFLGAVDDESREAERYAEVLYRLCFEMAVYLDEGNTLPSEEHPEGRLGFYMAMHMYAAMHLPPRLRLAHEVLADQVELNCRVGTSAWGDALEARCAEGKIPFVRWQRKQRMPTRPIPKFVTQATEPRRRRRRR